MSLRLGADIPRVDALAKVTGQARYTVDDARPGLVHAAFAVATIGKGRLLALDTAEAARIPGVLAVLTHETMGRLHPATFYFRGGHASQSFQPLQSDVVAYRGQPIALVVAETVLAAREAAGAVRARYEEVPVLPLMSADEAEDLLQAEALPIPPAVDKVAGDADAAFATAVFAVDARYETPAQHHNPIELMSVVVEWRDGDLTVHATAQGAEVIRQGLAVQLGLDPARIRVLAPLIGGGFGQKSALAPHIALAAEAARQVGRPLKLELPRAQITHAATFRPATRQRVRLGADAAGRMVAAIHEVRQQTSRHDLMPGFGTDVTARLYGIPNFRGQERLVPCDTQTPGFMRAPFEMATVFAFESAVDELALAIGADPVAFRLANDAAFDPITGKRFSSRHVGRCLEDGARRFGWSGRNPEPGSMRGADGSLLGMGVALGAYKAAAPTRARVRLHADGRVEASVAGHEMGQGLSTVVSLALADSLGVRLDDIRLTIGDTDAPPQHITGGSWGTTTAVPAICAVAGRVAEQLVRYACETQGGPLHGVPAAQARLISGAVTASDGRSESLSAILRRVDLAHLDGEVVSLAPGQTEQSFARASMGLSTPQGPVYPDFVSYTYAAHFAEVRIDPFTRQIGVSRFLSVVDCGRVASRRMARSQALGGLVWGIGSALLEESEVDGRRGGFLNADLAEYLVPVNADIRDLDVAFIDEPDPEINPQGLKGLGEITTVGAAAAIANAVHHATGKRIRHLPIRLDDLLD